ncbi:MAG: histidine phosphatase family protein [Ilumatobacteraceae bacterium]
MLYVVRHARTEANAGGRLQGRLDLPLDDVGREQAAALTRLVPAPGRLVVSPARRAAETASVFGVPHEVDDRWHEMDYGDLEGVRVADVPAATWAQWRADPHFTPAGGETLAAVAARVFAACDDLLDDAAVHDVVVVTHATPVKIAMAWALGADPTVTWRSFVDQASATRIGVRDGRPVLQSFNQLPA